VGSPLSCTGDERVAATTGGGGEAHDGEEKDTGGVPISSTFHSADSRRMRLGFGEEERE
jgi:hypothetical protein